MKEIYLTELDREYLNNIIKSESGRIAIRAKVLLAVDSDYYPSYKALAEKFSIDERTVAKIIKNYEASGVDGAVFLHKATNQPDKEVDGIENLYDCVKKLVEKKGMSIAEAIESVKLLKAIYKTDDAVRSLVLGDTPLARVKRQEREEIVKALEEKYLTHKEDFSLEEASALNRAIDEALGFIKPQEE